MLFRSARYVLGDVMRRKAGPFLQRMEAGFQENALSYLLVLRLVPAFPFWTVNLAPALLGVRLPVYVLATAVGIAPAQAHPYLVSLTRQGWIKRDHLDDRFEPKISLVKDFGCEFCGAKPAGQAPIQRSVFGKQQLAQDLDVAVGHITRPTQLSPQRGGTEIGRAHV